jgi:hypothetical protein
MPAYVRDGSQSRHSAERRGQQSANGEVTSLLSISSAIASRFGVTSNAKLLGGFEIDHEVTEKWARVIRTAGIKAE